LEGEFPGQLRVTRRSFVLLSEERADRIFRDYHRAHRQSATTQGEDAPRFQIPEAGDPYPNCSLPALEAATWVREDHSDRFRAFDLAIFEAFFGRTEDISDPTVLEQVGTECGIDSNAMREALESHQYRERVLQEDREARTLGIRGVPAILIPGRQPIVGAVPYMELKQAVESALQAAIGNPRSDQS
jgi:predicted DsbA family dithiol-disulfide isomerase